MDDRELLRRDRLSRRAEDVRVLQPHVRQHDDAGRVEHVGRIVAAAEPGLDDGGLGDRIVERHERRRRQHLELCCRQPFGHRPNGREHRLEVGLDAVDPHALHPRAHVRRQVGADAEAGVAEELLDHARRRRLPVRPDDVDRLEARLRIAELREEHPHPLEPETVLRPRREALQPGERGHPAS
jgi:hypothetical protein